MGSQRFDEYRANIVWQASNSGTGLELGSAQHTSTGSHTTFNFLQPVDLQKQGKNMLLYESNKGKAIIYNSNSKNRTSCRSCLIPQHHSLPEPVYQRAYQLHRTQLRPLPLSPETGDNCIRAQRLACHRV